jgi:hypothetical protein
LTGGRVIRIPVPERSFVGSLERFAGAIEALD